MKSMPEREPPERRKLIGVTGRMGSGKSRLCAILSRAHGCPVIDADALGHEALRESAAVRAALIARFGPSILGAGGEIDRRALADRVFLDASALGDLNEIVHPWIIEKIRERLSALRVNGGAGIVLLDAALLIDWRSRLPVDRVVVVRCPDLAAIERLRLRGMPEEEARRRLAHQIPEEELLLHADEQVDNGGSEEDLTLEAERLWQRLLRWKETNP